VTWRDVRKDAQTNRLMQVALQLRWYRWYSDFTFVFDISWYKWLQSLQQTATEVDISGYSYTWLADTSNSTHQLIHVALQLCWIKLTLHLSWYMCRYSCVDTVTEYFCSYRWLYSGVDIGIWVTQINSYGFTQITCYGCWYRWLYSYRVAKTHRIPHLYRSFSAKMTNI